MHCDNCGIGSLFACFLNHDCFFNFNNFFNFNH